MYNKGNGVFTECVVDFIESWISSIDIFDEIIVRHVLKDKPQSKLSNMRDSGEFTVFTHFWKYNQNRLVIAHVQINYL